MRSPASPSASTSSTRASSVDRAATAELARSRLDPGPPVLDGARERRNTREPLLGQVAPDLVFGIDARLEAAEQLQHALVVGERDAVALIAGRPHPVLRSAGRLSTVD